MSLCDILALRPVLPVVDVVYVVFKNTPELTIFDDNIDNSDNPACG